LTKQSSPPKSEDELLENARALAGKTLRQIAQQLDINIPSNQKHAKGWIGELMEIYLGATASSRPEPDFQFIGVELKTIPINNKGRPKESTFVCTVPLAKMTDMRWDDSNVKRKLSRVLWVPIEADPAIVLPQRRIGSAFIWSPNQQQAADLRADWEELMDMASLGELNQISSHHGKYLQIRPKAANARALVKTANEQGEAGFTLPRGFYLRTSFTTTLLQKYNPSPL